MKALEFSAAIGPDHKLLIPVPVASAIPEGRPVRVILLLPEDSEERDWNQLTREEFIKGYADGDAIYDAI